MENNKINLGLCQGRHSIPQIDGDYYVVAKF